MRHFIINNDYKKRKEKENKEKKKIERK